MGSEACVTSFTNTNFTGNVADTVGRMQAVGIQGGGRGAWWLRVRI